ncbi:MAG: hypothetical protein JJE05_07565 [Actinobacteria bacterium]|nr:hypothetical protein [Actinomycetota bacterium]
MSPEDIVDVVTADQVKQTIDAHLDDLGISFEELREQARLGEFQSKKARALWSVIEHFAQTA